MKLVMMIFLMSAVAEAKLVRINGQFIAVKADSVGSAQSKQVGGSSSNGSCRIPSAKIPGNTVGKPYVDFSCNSKGNDTSNGVSWGNVSCSGNTCAVDIL